MGKAVERKSQKELVKAQKIEEVICIAHRLFASNGYESVGMREISAAAGMSPMQLYRFNLNKADLLAEVILRVNDIIIGQIKPFKKVGFRNAQWFIENYLLSLYEKDIAIKSIRAEGAAFGWKWSGKYESQIIEQVIKMLKPISDALEHEGFRDIQARCYAIWSLYYVGYRNAVMNNADAKECLEEIKPSLAICLKK